MKQRNVYIIMSSIVVLTVGVFAFLFMNQSRALPVMDVLTDGNQQPSFSGILYGDFDNPLERPMDIATSGSFIYISDPDSHSVKVLEAGGALVFTIGERGHNEGQFQFPYGLDFNEETNQLYVADLYTGYISIFSDKGEFIGYFAEEYTEDGTIDSPGGLLIQDGRLYLTDVNNNQIHIFDLNGELLLSFGEIGDGPGEFLAPNFIALDKKNNIYVTDTGNHRVQVFTSEGEFIREINGTKDNAGDTIFVNPRGIAIDSRDILYVVNNLTHTVHAFDLEGTPLFTFGTMGQGVTDLYLPNGLLIDSRNTMYITDTLNQRVVMYR